MKPLLSIVDFKRFLYIKVEVSKSEKKKYYLFFMVEIFYSFLTPQNNDLSF